MRGGDLSVRGLHYEACCGPFAPSAVPKTNMELQQWLHKDDSTSKVTMGYFLVLDAFGGVGGNGGAVAITGCELPTAHKKYPAAFWSLHLKLVVDQYSSA